MKTYPIQRRDGTPGAFEIENFYIGLGRIEKLLSSLEGISNIRRRKLFELSDFLLEFDYEGCRYKVSEPFGDSNRYWIGPKNGLETQTSASIETIEVLFKNYQPNILLRMLGHIFTLDFIFRKK